MRTAEASEEGRDLPLCRLSGEIIEKAAAFGFENVFFALKSYNYRGGKRLETDDSKAAIIKQGYNSQMSI